MPPDQRMLRRRPRLPLLLGRDVAAELAREVPDRVLGHQALRCGYFNRVRKGIVDGARVDELGFGAVGWDDARVQHRPGCRFLAK